MSFAVFNPFFPNHGRHQPTIGLETQEVINYAESRFCSILRVIRKSENIGKMKWILTLLHRELIFVMSYIGIATALGQPVDVHIILRSLADVMGLQVDMGFPTVFEPEFLATLDLDRHNEDCKYRVVGSYQHQWWSGRKPRDLNVVDILNAETVISCLEHYQEQITGLWVMPEITKKQPTAGPSYAGSTTNAGSSYNAGSSQLAGQTTAGIPPTASSCPTCLQYKNILSDTLQDILNFRNFASVMSTSSENLLKIGMRKASTFHLLHEAAIMKETVDLEVQEPATTAQNIAAVRYYATTYMDKLRNNTLPESSYKWTWGETLTDDEVLALCRTGTNPGRAPHSGYDVSLREGMLLGDTTDVPSIPDSGRYEDLPADASVIPPSTHLSMPPYFSRHDRLDYDPHRSISPISEMITNSPPVSMPALAGHSVALQMAENWSSDRDSDMSGVEEIQPAPALNDHFAPGPAQAPPRPDTSGDMAIQPAPITASGGTALRVAEVWSDRESSGSNEALSPVPAPASLAPEVSQALFIADNWEDSYMDSDDEANDKAPVPVVSSQAPEVSQALLVADNWDSDLDSDEAPEPAVSQALLVADNWNSDPDSDDEAPAPVVSQALLVADNWNSEPDSGGEGSEGSGDESLPAASQTDDQNPAFGSLPVSTSTRTYGPEDFANLREDMFGDDSSDDD